MPKNKKLKILDIGTGYGFIASLLSGENFDICAIDIDPDKIATATQLALKHACPNFGVMDCCNMFYADETFDIVIACDVLYQIKKLPVAYSEIYRVLKKGGTVIVMEHSIPGETVKEENLLPARENKDIEILQTYGFSHCKMEICHQLYNDMPNLSFITAHKPLHGTRIHIPHLAKFNHSARTYKKTVALYENWCMGRNISYSEYMVLHMVSHHTKGARPSDISSALVIPRQTLTRILANLEKSEYIIRSQNANDKRSCFIKISPKGSKFLKNYHDHLHNIEMRALSEFTLEELTFHSNFADRLFKAFEKAFDRQ